MEREKQCFVVSLSSVPLSSLTHLRFLPSHHNIPQGFQGFFALLSQIPSISPLPSDLLAKSDPNAFVDEAPSGHGFIIFRSEKSIQHDLLKERIIINLLDYTLPRFGTSGLGRGDKDQNLYLEMGSFTGTSEIVEATDELTTDRKPPVLKLGYKDSLEDDINKLFEAINLKASSKGSDNSKQAGTSPLNKNALKKPITVGVSRSPGIGNSEPATLKQALRELSITKASEMAAMKRLSKLTSPSRASEAGRIKTLYNAVVVEASTSGPSSSENRGNMVEISLVPEESISNTCENTPEHPQMAKMKSSSQSAHSSPRFAIGKTENNSGSTTLQNESTSMLRTVGVQTIKAELGQKRKLNLQVTIFQNLLKTFLRKPCYRQK
ncbi:serine/threonine-protein kinase D6PKL1 [Prunus yedoensis var. nudiflora]|uniref:Serine/threonine-protein kinase D6PKL1 n=1 Tax=Prunus yedoensis var. nudiflora TaxID=2094558 RepID=A0A314XV70_PRUYE|nr:serine/threonine-protein kinase D6PKL1 [Prunus yedoensis var. nudiflora]